MTKRRTAVRIATSIAVAAVAVALAGALFGPRGVAVAGVVSLLGAAWRDDNEVGACLPLAILFLIVAGVLCLLIYLMMIAHIG